MIKTIYSILAIAGFCFLATPGFSASAGAVVPVDETTVSSNTTHTADWEKMTAKEKRTMRKEVKKALKDAKKSDSDVPLVLLVILAILIPPLAMALYDGISNRFWISLLLTLLFFVPGMIYTLVVILGDR